MQSIMINSRNKDVTEKVLWMLKRFENDGVEIVEKEDVEDLQLLAKTRNEESIPFSDYLKNHEN